MNAFRYEARYGSGIAEMRLKCANVKRERHGATKHRTLTCNCETSRSRIAVIHTYSTIPTDVESLIIIHMFGDIDKSMPQLYNKALGKMLAMRLGIHHVWSSAWPRYDNATRPWILRAASVRCLCKLLRFLFLFLLLLLFLLKPRVTRRFPF